MNNPAHPGELLTCWLDDFGMNVTAFAAHIGISRLMLSSVLHGHATLSADMDVRLSEALGITPGYWLALQTQRDLWIAQQISKNRKHIKRMAIPEKVAAPRNASRVLAMPTPDEDAAIAAGIAQDPDTYEPDWVRVKRESAADAPIDDQTGPYDPKDTAAVSVYWQQATITTPNIQAIQAPQQATAQYVPLKQVTKPNLTTAEAEFYLNRRPQTLRAWACLENGPIRPRRIGGLLAWPTNLIKALCGVPT
jgi:addiction module HigA family antidote